MPCPIHVFTFPEIRLFGLHPRCWIIYGRYSDAHARDLIEERTGENLGALFVSQEEPGTTWVRELPQPPTPNSQE